MVRGIYFLSLDHVSSLQHSKEKRKKEKSNEKKKLTGKLALKAEIDIQRLTQHIFVWHVRACDGLAMGADAAIDNCVYTSLERNKEKEKNEGKQKKRKREMKEKKEIQKKKDRKKEKTERKTKKTERKTE